MAATATPKKTKKPTALYHVGLNPDAPYDVIHIAGFEFPKRSERVEGFGASTKRSSVQGTYLNLTDDDVARIKKGAEEKVFRFGTEVVKQRGKKETRYRRAFLLSTAGQWQKPYEEREDDVPVGRFIFIRKADHTTLKDEHFEPLMPAADDTAAKAKKVS